VMLQKAHTRFCMVIKLCKT